MSNRLRNEQHLQKVDIAHFLVAPMGATFYKNYFRIILRVSSSAVQMCYWMEAVDTDFVFITKTNHRCFFGSSGSITIRY